jgi:WD40 repeat protein
MARLLAASGALALALLVAAPSRATFPAHAQRLVIETESSGELGLELLGPGKTNIPVFAPIGVGGSVAMSADGRHIALNFSTPGPEGGSAGVLTVSDFLGFDGAIVATGASGGGRPSFSPDGTRVAYAVRDGGDWDIFVSETGRGAAPTNLTPTSAANDRNPRWSPDGNRIAFESDRDGNVEVYTMAANGSSQSNLTRSAAAEHLGDWSPDSGRIVFTSDRTGGGDLYVEPASGGPSQRVTSAPGAETHAAWSPDGSTIAYSSDVDGDAEVYEIAPDGSNVRRLTDNSYLDVVQDWQPLLDTTRPRTQALPSTGRRHHAIRLRFKLAEDSRQAAVVVEFAFAVPHGGQSAGTIDVFRSIVSGRTYSVSFPASSVAHAPRSFRFCAMATDGSLNDGAESCARFRFLPAPKKTKPKTKGR